MIASLNVLAYIKKISVSESPREISKNTNTQIQKVYPDKECKAFMHQQLSTKSKRSKSSGE